MSHIILFALSLHLSPAAPAAVAGETLKKELKHYIDRTLTVTDRYGGRSTHFGNNEQKLGFAPDAVVKIRLARSGLYAFLPRTDALDTRLDALQVGDPISVVGVIEARRFDGTHYTDIGLSLPDRTLVFVNGRDLRTTTLPDAPLFLHPDTVDPDDYVDVRVDDITLQPADYVDNDITFERYVTGRLVIGRYYSAWEREQGLDKDHAIKLSVGTGFPLFLERNKDNLAVLQAWRKGAHVRFYGNLRVHRTSSGDHPVLVVHRWELTTGKSRRPTHDL